jgi:hypothetical protein
MIADPTDDREDAPGETSLDQGQSESGSRWRSAMTEESGPRERSAVPDGHLPVSEFPLPPDQVAYRHPAPEDRPNRAGVPEDLG